MIIAAPVNQIGAAIINESIVLLNYIMLKFKQLNYAECVQHVSISPF